MSQDQHYKSGPIKVLTVLSDRQRVKRHFYASEGVPLHQEREVALQ